MPGHELQQPLPALIAIDQTPVMGNQEPTGRSLRYGGLLLSARYVPFLHFRPSLKKQYFQSDKEALNGRSALLCNGSLPMAGWRRF